jgi:hypothetical protein
MTDRSYKLILAALGLICAILTPLIILSIVPTGVGTAAFVAVIAWIILHVAQTRQKARADRQHGTHRPS